MDDAKADVVDYDTLAHGLNELLKRANLLRGNGLVQLLFLIAHARKDEARDRPPSPDA